MKHLEREKMSNDEMDGNGMPRTVTNEATMSKVTGLVPVSLDITSPLSSPLPSPPPPLTHSVCHCV